MENRDIAAVLEEVADLLEFQGANHFRVRAYRSGARTVRDLGQSVATIVAAGEQPLSQLKGIGKDLAAKIETLVETGALPLREELLAEIPESVLALLRIPGLGPKKAATLFRELEITTLDMLERACQHQEVRSLSGFGPKTEETILAGIALARQADERILWALADKVVAQIRDELLQAKGVVRLEAAGSYRRGQETVGDLDFLVEANEPDHVMDAFGAMDEVSQVLLRGDTKMSVRLQSGLQVDLRVVRATSFGAALQYFTGSKEHNVALRSMARERGLKVNEYGVYPLDADGEQPDAIAGATEAEVYAAVGMPWIPPELREARGEFEWANGEDIPRLIEESDIRGDLHMHTDYTDGVHSLREMADAASERGLEYIAITDHSQRVSMAGGLGPAKLRQQWEQIDQLNRELETITILKGIECDILEGGGMDLPDDVLAEADWVIASIHYGQKQTRAQITERILGALANPHVSIVAHPTGRLIQKREPYEVDLAQVIGAAAEYGKLLEINANPRRLDLNDIDAAEAQRRGVPIVISTDAHRREGLSDLRYGIMQARRAGLKKHDVANTLPWDQLRQLIGKQP